MGLPQNMKMYRMRPLERMGVKVKGRDFYRVIVDDPRQMISVPGDIFRAEYEARFCEICGAQDDEDTDAELFTCELCGGAFCEKCRSQEKSFDDGVAMEVCRRCVTDQS